jgi:hypothetical protein
VRRLARHLFTLCSAVSLVLCVAACVLWVRSYWYIDWLSREAGGTGFTHQAVEIDRGHIVCHRRYNTVEYEAGWSFESEPREPDASSMLDDIDRMGLYVQDADFVSTRWWGFRYGRGYGDTGLINWVVVPIWFLAAVTALPPLFSLRRVQSNSYRKRRNLCSACGYNLRATPERCPGCGAPKPAAV